MSHIANLEPARLAPGFAADRSKLPACTREQARDLLSQLRAEYRLLSPEVRDGVKHLLLTFARSVPAGPTHFAEVEE